MVHAKWIVRAIVLTTALMVAIYGGSLDSPLVGPDTRTVIDNYYLADPGLAAKLFVSGGGGAGAALGRYAPLAGVSLATDMALWGTSPQGFRVVSLVLHIVSTLLLLLLMARFGVGAGWALLAALIFAVHPIHTQSIHMISSRGHLLSVVLTLAAAIVFSRPLLGAAKGARLARPAGSWAALVLFTLGLFCGVEALTFALFCLLLPPALGVRYPHWRFYAGLAVALGVYVVLSALAGGDHAIMAADSHRIVASILKGLALVLIPSGQMIYHPIGFVYSWADGRTLAGLAVVAGTFAGCAALRNRARILSLSLGFAGCAILPSILSAFEGGAVHEPGLYMLAAAVCAVVAALAELSPHRPAWRPLLLGVMIVLVGAGTVGSLGRCAVWADPERVWLEVLDAHPDNPLALRELADYYRGAGLTDKAAALVSPASSDSLSQATQLNNEGVALRDAGRISAAVMNFREAITLWPDFSDAHFNLGVAYHDMRMPDSAAACFKRAIEANPMRADSRYNLAIVYDGMGDYGGAEFQYREAVRLDPSHARALANLGAIRGRAGDFQEAIDLLERAIEIDPGLVEARFNLALSYESVDAEKARGQWRAYIDLARRRGVNPQKIQQAQGRLDRLQ